MRIESQSLAPYIYHLEGDMSHNKLNRVWRDILKFPDENWAVQKSTSNVLHPSRVLARMLCVKIDRYVGYSIRRISSRSESDVPLSWLLRLIPDDEWKPGEVLIFAKSKSNKEFDEDFYEIQKYFPKLFDEIENQSAAVEKIEKIIRNYYSNYEDGTLIHVSAPKFHKVWDHVISGYGNKKPRKDAKKQWSMTANAIFEGICAKETENGPSVILQSGGGHVLLLLPAGVDPKEFSERMLSGMSKRFQKQQKWSPLIWSSWDNGFWRSWEEPKEDAKEIITRLQNEYKEARTTRHESSKQWAIFKSGAREVPATSSGGDLATFYLDVIDLGNYCWPARGTSDLKRLDTVKFKDPGDEAGNRHLWPEEHKNELAEIVKENEKKGVVHIKFLDRDIEKTIFKRFAVIADKGDFEHLSPGLWPVPTRSREEAIEGFSKSRKITPVIESTFGHIFAKHHPKEVVAMGGDEIVLSLPASEFIDLITNIEKHTLQLHTTIFDERHRLLWWAFCSDKPPDSYTQMKETVRNMVVSEKNTITRFVNPLWTDFIQ